MLEENIKETVANDEVSDENKTETTDKTENKKDASKIKSEVKKLVAELEEEKEKNKKLSLELDEEKDKYLRMLAEYDNFRRRSQKDKENTYADAYGDALSEFLPVLDNIERALEYAESESAKEGIRMIMAQVTQAMDKLGIEAFAEKGDTFDPMIHNAVMHVDDEALGENVIADIFQRGYRRGEKIIRHAMVKVAN